MKLQKQAADAVGRRLSEAQCKYNKNDRVRLLMKRPGVDVTAESNGNFEVFDISLIRQPLVVGRLILIPPLYFLPTLFPCVLDTF